MKKKIAAAIVMAALLAFALAGCSQGAGEKAADEGFEVGTEAVEPAESEEVEPAEGQQVEDADELEANASSSKPAASNNSGSSASKPSSGNNSSGGSNGSSTSKPETPAHEHSWVHHEAVYIENPVYASKLVCSCGSMFDTNAEWTVHNKALVMEDPESGCSYSVKKVQVGTEKVLAEAEYWSCSCGATK